MKRFYQKSKLLLSHFPWSFPGVFLEFRFKVTTFLPDKTYLFGKH